MSRFFARGLRVVDPTVDQPSEWKEPPARLRPALSPPVDVTETLLRMRAQSALCGLQYADGSRNPGVLTIEQASDVMAWYAPRLT